MTTSRAPLRIVLAGGISALAYIAVMRRFPLLTIFHRPIQNLYKLAGADDFAALTLISGVLLLFAAYALGALALARQMPAAESHAQRRVTYLFVIAFPLLFVAILWLVYPTTSLDLYDYLFRGRMLARYGANTFIDIPRDFAGDPLMRAKPVRFIPWDQAVTAYGPVWEGLSWLTARLAGEAQGVVAGEGAARDAQLLRLMLAYKSLGALGFLLCGAAIWGALGRLAPEWRRSGLYLWLWNPLALWESVAAGHNDVWMALTIVLAMWAFAANRENQGRASTQVPLSRPLLAFLSLTIGGLIKFLSLFLAPLLLSAALRRLGGWRERGRLIIVGGLLCAAVAALAYAPFWAGWETFRNIGNRGTLFTASWLAVLEASLAVEMPRDVSQGIAALLGLGLLIAGVLWSAVRAWRAPDKTPAHALWLVLWFLLLANPWFQPWYLLWALALVALQPARGRMAWCVGLFCCTAMLSYIPEALLLPQLGWQNNRGDWHMPIFEIVWNALTSALVYGPPMLALAWGRSTQRASSAIERLRKAVRFGRAATPPGEPSL